MANRLPSLLTRPEIRIDLAAVRWTLVVSAFGVDCGWLCAIAAPAAIAIGANKATKNFVMFPPGKVSPKPSSAAIFTDSLWKGKFKIFMVPIRTTRQSRGTFVFAEPGIVQVL